MRELTVNMMISLDGFAGGSDDDDVQAEFGAGFGPELAAYMRRVLDEPQVMLMGRVTYEEMAGYWSRSSGEQAEAMNRLPKLVVSTTLTEPLAWRNSRLLTGELAEVIAALKSQPGDPIYSVGSIGLVHNLPRLGLVDRLRLVVFPVVYGAAGRRPMFEGIRRLDLDLVEATTLDASVVVLEYRSQPKAPAR
jgi:dihydrofolate reductase